ncbi:MAG: helix-turn-helix transcriptional regulator [Clostridia bacterium]|nr:helix-turn-helix transcriptional regulator [Clostridia bacterium]
MTIKELRAEKKLSQKAFGESLGISAAAVAKLEKDNKPSEKVIKAVKDVYGVDLAAEAAEAPKATKKAAPKAAEEKKAEPKKAAKKAEPKAAEEKPVEEKKTAKKAPGKTEVFIQSAMGGTITVEEVLSRLDAVDTVYIKVEENKAYWVKGDENGSVDLW